MVRLYIDHAIRIRNRGYCSQGIAQHHSSRKPYIRKDCALAKLLYKLRGSVESVRTTRERATLCLTTDARATATQHRYSSWIMRGLLQSESTSTQSVPNRLSTL